MLISYQQVVEFYAPKQFEIFAELNQEPSVSCQEFLAGGVGLRMELARNSVLFLENIVAQVNASHFVRTTIAHSSLQNLASDSEQKLWTLLRVHRNCVFEVAFDNIQELYQVQRDALCIL